MLVQLFRTVAHKIAWANDPLQFKFYGSFLLAGEDLFITLLQQKRISVNWGLLQGVQLRQIFVYLGTFISIKSLFALAYESADEF